jgi:hypothetical protein
MKISGEAINKQIRRRTRVVATFPRAVSPAKELTPPDMIQVKHHPIQILNMQLALHEKQIPIVVVIEGPDAAGEGGAIKRLTERLDPRLLRVWRDFVAGRSRLSSSMRAAMSLGRPAALRQSQSAHNSRLNRVRFHSGCAWRSPQIPSVSEVLRSRPCMTMMLAVDAN